MTNRDQQDAPGDCLANEAREGSAASVSPCDVVSSPTLAPGSNAGGSFGKAYHRATPWTAEDVAHVGAMLEQGKKHKDIAPLYKINVHTFRKWLRKNDIKTRNQTVPESVRRGAAVLRQHYHTMMPTAQVLALYIAARAMPVTIKNMHAHAAGLKIARPTGLQVGIPLAAKVALDASRRARRERIAAAVKQRLAEGAYMSSIMTEMGFAQGLLQTMKREGLLENRVYRSFPPAQPVARKPRAVKPPPAPKPKRRPASWVRPELPAAPAPIVKIEYETVEAWLARGNQITRCPAAVCAPSQHVMTSPEDRATITSRNDAERAALAKAKPGDALRRSFKVRQKISDWAARVRAVEARVV